jgi:hypothetical protein
MTDDFSEKFCRQYKVSPADYRAALLRRTLYPSARILAPVLRLIDRDHFAADHRYIDSLAHLRRLRDLVHESQEYTRDPANRRFLRGTLRLRVSVGRMQDIVHNVMNDVVAS